VAAEKQEGARGRLVGRKKTGFPGKEAGGGAFQAPEGLEGMSGRI